MRLLYPMEKRPVCTEVGHQGGYIPVSLQFPKLDVCVCTENLNTGVVVMKSAQDGA